MSKKGHLPRRMCVVCRKRFYKSELIRYRTTSEGLKRDDTRCPEGRGIYLCTEVSCMIKAEKRWKLI